MPAHPSSAAVDAVAVNAVLIAVRQAAQLLCDRATLLLVLHAHAGANTFSALAERTALPSKVLSARLAQLVESEILVRMPYSRRPLRHAYHLSHMGADLFDVLALCAHWEACWPHPAHVGPAAVQLVHAGCRPDVAGLQVQCSHCRTLVDPRDVLSHVSQREVEAMPQQATTKRRSAQGAAQPEAASGPLAQSLVALGDKWGIEVLVCAFLRVQRFSDFASHTGIATNILADRLERLTRIGLLARDSEDPTGRRAVYSLTPKGRALYPVLIAIQQWADQWLVDRVLSPVKLRHQPCGHLLSLTLACSQCGQPITKTQGRLVLTGQTADGAADIAPHFAPVL